MTKHGGARAGAGRPKGSEEQATLDKRANRAMLRELVKPHLAAIVAAQVDNAKGVPYLILRDSSGAYVRATDEKQEEAQSARNQEAARQGPKPIYDNGVFPAPLRSLAERDAGRLDILREIAKIANPSVWNANHDTAQCIFCLGEDDDSVPQMDYKNIKHRPDCLWLRAQEAAK